MTRLPEFGRLLFYRAFIVACVATILPALAPAAERPNVVFIMADDLGWADLGCYGSSFYETPYSDRLAREGMRFTNAYSACPVCSPTRAAVMTGKYPARLHLTDYIPGARRGKLNPATYVKYLPLEEVTVAEVFKQADYCTGLVGKWHLGERGYWPENQGFDINIAGCQKGSTIQMSPYGLPNLSDGPKGEYLTDRLTDEAIKFIEAKKDRPFLLWLTHYDVHTPLVAKRALIKKFEAKAAMLSPPSNPRFRPEGKAVDRRIQDHAVYAAKVASLDESVGRITAKLEQLGIADRTIVVLTSDNGGLSTAEGAPTSNAPLRAGKGWLYEGGIRVPLIVKWPGVVRPGRVCDTPVITNDEFPTLIRMARLETNEQTPLDCQSLIPLLKEASPLERTTLYWHYPHYGNQGGSPGGAIRDGKWKLIEFFEDDHVELYDLELDLGEQHDLAETHPDKARELREQLHAWWKSVDAQMPTPNPDFKPEYQTKG